MKLIFKDDGFDENFVNLKKRSFLSQSQYFGACGKQLEKWQPELHGQPIVLYKNTPSP